MAKITAIILVMVGLVIGVNIIEPINSAVSPSLISLTEGFSAAVISLSALLPLLFIVVLMVFAVKAIGDAD